MSYKSLSRTCEVSDTDTDSNYTRGHRYNTRFSARNPHVARRLIDPPIDSSPSFIFNRRNLRNCPPSPPAENSAEMDYCYEDFPQRERSYGKCWRLLQVLFYIALLAGMGFILWSIYLMREEIDRLQADLTSQSASDYKGEDPQEKVLKELNKKYSDALKRLLQDPVGLPDFALESSGGRIVSSDAQTYAQSSGKIFGFTLCQSSHSASAMIRATSAPGECWAFKGQTASAIIQLIGEVMVTSVTLEHIPKTISPSGTIDSAPKDFKIWGLHQPNRKQQRQLLGEFTYQREGSTFQTFRIANTSFFKYVEFEVLSNHGNKDYTCVYRIRVHGKLRSTN